MGDLMLRIPSRIAAIALDPPDHNPEEKTWVLPKGYRLEDVRYLGWTGDRELLIMLHRNDETRLMIYPRGVILDRWKSGEKLAANSNSSPVQFYRNKLFFVRNNAIVQARLKKSRGLISLEGTRTVFDISKALRAASISEPVYFHYCWAPFDDDIFVSILPFNGKPPVVKGLRCLALAAVSSVSSNARAVLVRRTANKKPEIWLIDPHSDKVLWSSTLPRTSPDEPALDRIAWSNSNRMGFVAFAEDELLERQYLSSVSRSGINSLSATVDGRPGILSNIEWTRSGAVFGLSTNSYPNRSALYAVGIVALGTDTVRLPAWGRGAYAPSVDASGTQIAFVRRGNAHADALRLVVRRLSN